MTLLLRYPFTHSTEDDLGQSSQSFGVVIVDDEEMGPVAKFNGDSYIKGPILPPRDHRTISYWIKLTGKTSTQFVHSGGYFMKSSTWGTYMNSNKIWGYLESSKCITDIPSAGEWFNVCEVYDKSNGSMYHLYINGTLKKSCSRSFEYGTNNIYIGYSERYKKYDLKLEGCLSDFRVYDNALGLSEVDELYNFGPNMGVEIPATLELVYKGSQTLIVEIEGDPAVNYRVTVSDEGEYSDFVDSVKPGDKVRFDHLSPGTAYSVEII